MLTDQSIEYVERKGYAGFPAQSSLSLKSDASLPPAFTISPLPFGRIDHTLGFPKHPGDIELETLVTADTLLRWYRELVASKWNFSHRRGPGRPRVMKTIVELILQMALENPSWGYTRIRGALANLGHQVGRGTVANILRDNGIEPALE
jgi:hypothetical protein